MRFDPNDPVVRKAVELSLSKGKFSTAMLQTYLGKGHGFVAGLADWLEEIGVIGPADSNRPRDVLIGSMKEFDERAVTNNGATQSAAPEVVVKEESLIPNKLSLALKERSSDFDFNSAIVLSFIGSFLIIPFFCGLYLLDQKKKVEKYYDSEEFKKLKRQVEKNAEEANELNQHIEDLKDIQIGENDAPHEKASLTSGGNHNYKREGWKLLDNDKNTHHCSAQTAMNARNNPYKYICKYFNIEPNEENLNGFEEMFNNFSAAVQGQTLLPRVRNDLFASISDKVPDYVIKYTPNRLVRELGFKPVKMKKIIYPKFRFLYVSPGGNSNIDSTFELNLERLEGFIEYLNSQINWRKSVAGQRALMTSTLRELIKRRDDYTCKKCGASVYKEPNLLLEIDHIKPLSKGGITSEENLQTLCWRCNRSKGAKEE